VRDLPAAPYDPGYDLPEPSDAELRRLAQDLGFELSEATFASMAERVRGTVGALGLLAALDPATPPTRHPRLAGGPPGGEDNPYNAWSWRCEVDGAADGPLRGVTVAVKESVCVAGVPMSNGSAVLEHHIPAYDATVVSRLLDAGATVNGRATSENFGLSSGSNTSSSGPVLNPAAPTHSTGGSSSGCAALVAAAACDIAVGTDQGGSVRIPAALCGVVGLKPTYGAVPYTGVLSIETSLDHVGLFGRDVATVAEAFALAAGPDGFDPRRCPPTTRPRRDPGRDGPGRIALVTEGVDAVDEGHDVGALVDSAVERLRASGATVDTITIPEHAVSGLVATPIYAEGICSQLFESGGTSLGWKGFYPEHELVATLRGLKAQPALLPDTGKLFALVGAHLRRTHLGRYYARAQNLAIALREVYDDRLADYDALLMPTCAPFPVALPLPEAPSPDDVFDAAFGYHLNAAVFNLTGHPAVSVPAGHHGDLPFGMMLVGAHDDEAVLLQLATALEPSTEEMS